MDAYYGRFKESRHAIEQAKILALKANDLASISGYSGEEALRDAEVGDSVRAEQVAVNALKTNQSPATQLDLALAFARIGDLEHAQKLADIVSQGAALDTVVQGYCLPTIRAAMKLDTNDPVSAVEILRPTTKYELAYTYSFNSLYPAYIRGLAYLKMGEGRLAAAEFKKLPDHPGIVGTSVTGSLARLQLGRAQKMMGDEAAARKAYEDFLTLWKDADSDIPIYQQARAEYAKLKP